MKHCSSSYICREDLFFASFQHWKFEVVSVNGGQIFLWYLYWFYLWTHLFEVGGCSCPWGTNIAKVQTFVFVSARTLLPLKSNFRIGRLLSNILTHWTSDTAFRLGMWNRMFFWKRLIVKMANNAVLCRKQLPFFTFLIPIIKTKTKTAIKHPHRAHSLNIEHCTESRSSQL